MVSRCQNATKNDAGNSKAPECIAFLLTSELVGQLLLLQLDRQQLRLVFPPESIDFAQRILQSRYLVVPLSALRFKVAFTPA